MMSESSSTEGIVMKRPYREEKKKDEEVYREMKERSFGGIQPGAQPLSSCGVDIFALFETRVRSWTGPNIVVQNLESRDLWTHAQTIYDQSVWTVVSVRPVRSLLI